LFVSPFKTLACCSPKGDVGYRHCTKENPLAFLGRKNLKDGINKMKTALLILSLFAGLVGIAHAADSNLKSKVSDAAKQLGDKLNYSWTSTSKEADGSTGRLGPMDGKTEKGGLTYLSFTVSDVPVEVYIKGEKGAAKALEGWQSFEDISQTGGSAAAIVKYLRNSKVPVGESIALAEKADELKEADGVVSGDLKEEAVKELLMRGARRREGQDPPKITGSKGSVKFWIKEGVLAKYEVNVQGKVVAGDRETDVNRTTIVEIKEPGTTKLELPADAKEKLT
jgi:hypothetical protein